MIIEAPAGDASGRDNLRQLVVLRWIAVGGQLLTVLLVRFAMGVALPLAPMLVIIAGLVALNVVSTARLRRHAAIANSELFLALLLDVAALTGLLYLSGGATNPFVSLFLLQVVLASVLLESWSSWIMVVVTAACFAGLVVVHRPLELPPDLAIGQFDLYVAGGLANFVLVAVLLVAFVTRIGRNLRARDARLAALRQRAAEEDHIVRMGLLASGAAHELGTPLASLAVILNDWRTVPAVARDAGLREELADAQAAVERCKAIVTGILLSAGDARGEQPRITGARAWLEGLVGEWRAQNPGRVLTLEDELGADLAIVADTALKQVIWNVLDNGWEASERPVRLRAIRSDGALQLVVRDSGPGFTDEALANLGQPYNSTKGREGGGLGLFLVSNVMRKLGGSVTARNRPDGGAEIVLALPLASIAAPSETGRDGR